MHAFAFLRMDSSSPGPLCEEISLCSEILALGSIELIPKVDQGKVNVKSFSKEE